VPSKVGVLGAPPLWFLVVRFGSPAVRAGRRALLGATLPRSRKDWVAVAALGILGNAVYLGCTYIALRHLASGVGAIVASTNPLTLALVAPWLLREPLTPAKISGCCSASAGRVDHAVAHRNGDRTAATWRWRSPACWRRRSDDRVQEVLRRPRPARGQRAAALRGRLVLLPLAIVFEGSPQVRWSWSCRVVLVRRAGDVDRRIAAVVLAVDAWRSVSRERLLFLTPCSARTRGAAAARTGRRARSRGLAAIAVGISLVQRA